MISSGDKVKHYEILEPLGKEGMGEVFFARDTILDRKVAIKFLPEEMQKEPQPECVFFGRLRLLHLWIILLFAKSSKLVNLMAK
jgi:serine/threonine protein kinase